MSSGKIKIKSKEMGEKQEILVLLYLSKGWEAELKKKRKTFNKIHTTGLWKRKYQAYVSA